jgi:hypothetical protein
MTVQPKHQHRVVRLLTGSLAALALTAGATAVGTAAAAPARAEAYHHTDPAHDVVDRQSTDATDTIPAPHQRTVDITRWNAAYRHSAVVSTMHVRDLVRGPWNAIWFLKTPDKDEYSLVLRHTDSGIEMGLLHNHQTVPCTGLAKQARYGKDTLSVSVPRSCLGKPRYVRVEPDTGLTDSAGHDYEDNGMRDGALNYTEIAYGPRLHRG